MALSYKIVLVGDGGVGKSAYLKRHRTGEFEKKYIATQGVDVAPLTFNTNYGPIIFKVWDCAGQEKFGGLRDGYYTKADAAIVMFDLTSRVTATNALLWIESVRSVSPNIPVIICGNKCDIPDRKVIEKIGGLDLSNVKYFTISAQGNFNFEKPWLELARKLTSHEDLEFTDKPAITPPEVNTNSRILPSLPLPTQKSVSWMKLPNGAAIKITYEYYPEAEVMDILKY
jgi:GTP-binding nuclear protein Ran